ncbi:uncharacterized protein EV420DRAFT_1067189 [Desarmillaria tabescens]|uniref:Uncharacterized protein n=1 Tax=Armillaria tabescens TaxID=1929756 RepID=A0AA39JI01_ARMTA|nr:uncharacterized protein EV420DRAFT_1067189 [Desarmillaria tabescens]KAK0443121.1 hypothetical protein EV420DRAFT_1067189 [Desarmillaria tabescens]
MRRYRDEVDHLRKQLAIVNSFFDDGPTKGKGKQRPNPLPTPPQDIFQLPEYQMLNNQPSLPTTAGTSHTQPYPSVSSKLSQAIQQAQSQYDPALGRQNVIVGGAQPESRVTIPPEQECHDGPSFLGAGRLIGYLRGDDGSFHLGHFTEQSLPQAGPSKHSNALQTTASTTSLLSTNSGASSEGRPHQRSNTFPRVSFDTSANSSQRSPENPVSKTQSNSSVTDSRAGGRGSSQQISESTESRARARPPEQPQSSQSGSQQRNARTGGATTRRRSFSTGIRMLLQDQPPPSASDNISIVSWGTSAISDGSSLRSMNILSSFVPATPGAPESYVVPVGDPSAFLPLRNPAREEEGGVLSPLEVEWIPQTRPAPRGRHRRLSSVPSLPPASRATVRPTSAEGLGRRGLVDETAEENDNALGLVDLRRREDSPFIAQPTPMVPAAHFLRSFSHHAA